MMETDNRQTKITNPKTEDQKPKPLPSAILLAAGRSERMGAFKPLLPFGHTSVIQACLQSLREGGVEDIVIVVGHRADDIRAELKDSAVRIAVNDDPASEMDVSIARGTQSLAPNFSCVLVALVDHPAVPPAVVETLLAAWQDGARLVIPTWKNRGGHPVLVDASFRKELTHLDPEHGLKSLFVKHHSQVQRIAVDTPYVARDIDTWDDYCALHEEVFGFAPRKLRAS